jgi:predicted alpha/beta superfamily hydrolase
MVAAPHGADLARAYPVLYVLDGNQYFGTASEALTRQSALRDVAPAVVVGIGYPTDDPTEVLRRRAFDLTPSPSKIEGKHGGGDTFLRVIEEEVKPFVQARYKVDAANQIIWGQSIAGLLVLRQLFRNPAAYSTYILSSPAIWWNDREVLRDEETFSVAIRESNLKLKVLITSASDEQYRDNDPRLLAEETERMVDNASELAGRLAILKPQLTVARVIFEGELHSTVPQASLSRALRFALPVK